MEKLTEVLVSSPLPLISLSSPPQAKYLTKKTQASSVDAMKLLDEMLIQLVVRRRVEGEGGRGERMGKGCVKYTEIEKRLVHLQLALPKIVLNSGKHYCLNVPLVAVDS